MDPDVHGPGLAMLMLTLGLLVVLYADAIWNVVNDIFVAGSSLGPGIFAIVLIGIILLVGARVYS